MGTETILTGDDVGGGDGRLLVLAATTRDGELTLAVLAGAGVAAHLCAGIEDLLANVRRGAAAVLLAEEALSPGHTAAVKRVLAEQPPWSDLPLLILTRPGADSAELGEAIHALGNVTLLERPLRVATLVSAVRTALRARQRQYEIRRHLADRARTEELLRQADRRKDEFLATLGHELRNPLAPLLTGLQLVKANTPQDSWVVSVMERQLRHLTRLVDDLLEVSRITRGLIEVHREPLDLAAVVQAAVETTRPAIAAAAHTLRVELPAETITVNGDAMRLTQVFANLLTNASKYTNSGGRIELTVRRAASTAVISVRDTGIGIAPDQLGSVFEMFTQVDRSSRRSQGGLGIGLTLVRSLVAMHGGTVEARSEGADAGSEFVVELPLAAAAVRRRTREEDGMGQLPPRRILVVDDNGDAAETLARLLGILGATVSVANSGPETLELFETFRPDTVLLDIGMPDMDGYEVARRLRGGGVRSDVLLIALTGWGQDHDQAQAHAAGFDRHMIKPPDIRALHDMLWEGWPVSPD